MFRRFWFCLVHGPLQILHIRKCDRSSFIFVNGLLPFCSESDRSELFLIKVNVWYFCTCTLAYSRALEIKKFIYSIVFLSFKYTRSLFDASSGSCISPVAKCHGLTGGISLGGICRISGLSIVCFSMFVPYSWRFRASSF